MTCYVVLELSKLWKINIRKTEVMVSSIASDIRGTCAHLETGDVLTVE